jgi:hypothetical protein
MVVHPCNFSTQKLRQEDQEFKVSLSYTVIPQNKTNHQNNNKSSKSSKALNYI